MHTLLLWGTDAGASDVLELLLPPPPPLPQSQQAPAAKLRSKLSPAQQREQAVAHQQKKALQVLRYRPDDEAAIIALAECHLHRKQTTAAIWLLEDKLDRYPHLAKVSLALAKLNLEAGDATKAGPRIVQARNADPALPDLHFWWSNYHLRNEEPLAALRTIQQPHPYATPQMAAQGELLRGIAMLQVGLPADARQQFAAFTNYQDEEVAREARTLLDELDAARETGRFQSVANLVARYDTNPSLVPTTNLLGTPQTALPSWVAQADATASYDLMRYGNTKITAAHSILSAHVFEESEFDQLDNNPSLSLDHRGIWYDWLPYQAGLRADYDYLQVGGNGFLQWWGVSPSLTLMHHDQLTSTWTMRYSNIDYVNREVFENTVLDADGENYSTGCLVTRRFAEMGLTCQTAYNLNRNLTQGGNPDFIGHQAQGAVLWDVPQTTWTLNLVGSVDFRNYDEADFFSGVERRDRELRLQAQLIIPLADRWDFLLGVSHNRNSSTAVTSEFQRETYEIGLRFHTTPESAH